MQPDTTMAEPQPSLREFLEANMFDGDAGGTLTMDGNRLLDEICDLVEEWSREQAKEKR